MTGLQALAALILPLLLGGLCLQLIVPKEVPGRPWVVWGNGMLAGLIAIPLLIRLFDALGMSLSYPALASVVAAAIAFAALALYLRAMPRGGVRHPAVGKRPMPPSTKLTMALLLVLLGLRVTTLALELWWQPLFPFDATMHWATKARVWYEHASLVPFVDNLRWLELGGEGVFTDHHAGYPVTIPLLQLWMSLAVGQWDESLINLPWLACYVGLGALFYGQSRVAGASPVMALVFSYMLMSLPLVNSHVALAGYADLFLGACYCAAVMAFYNWANSRQAWQAVLACFFAFACPLVKNEGFYWLLTFVPALIVLYLPLRTVMICFAVLSALAVGALLVIPEDFQVAGHSVEMLRLGYRPGVLRNVAASLWVQDNWHLVAYLMLVLLPLTFLPLSRHKVLAEPLVAILAALASGVMLLLVLFVFTKYSYGAFQYTAVNRIAMHLVPALIFMLQLLYRHVWGAASLSWSSPTSPG